MRQLADFLFTQDSSWSILTFPFLVTFVLFYAAYLLLTRGSRRTTMMCYVVAFSLFFAWKANGALMVLLPASAFISWYLTRRMMASTSARNRKWWLAATIVIDLLPLVYFKYTNFLISIVNDIVSTNMSPMSLILPVGLSFYTFQTISYSVDVYRGRFTLETSLLEYLFYITFFPLLMAGPITRAGTLIPQLKRDAQNTRSSILVYSGLWLIILGLLKKALVADYIAEYNNWIFEDPTAYSGFENVMAVFGYSLQIYCDFSGYSDVSIGIAALMGFRLKENFRFPYQSLNLQEFWRRWHIALSTWFRDYLYIPLGGNRKGEWRTYFNNFFTMVVAGLWHGASWMFLIWGAMHGLGLVVHKYCKRWLDRLPDTIFTKAGAWVVTFLYLQVTWLFFRAPTWDNAMAMCSHIWHDFDWAYLVPFVKARPVWTLLTFGGLLMQGIRQRHADRLRAAFIRSPWLLKLIIFAIVIQMVVNLSQDNVRPFIYAQF